MTRLIHYAKYEINENLNNEYKDRYKYIEYGDILENVNNPLDTNDLLDYLQDIYRITFIKGFYYDRYTELETFALYKDSFLLLHSIVDFDILEDNEIEILNYIKDCISKDKNERNEIVFEFRY